MKIKLHYLLFLLPIFSVGQLTFSDNFESGNINQWTDRGGSYSYKNTATNPVYQGDYALQMQGYGSNSHNYGLGASFTPIQPVHIRFSVNTNDILSANNYVVITPNQASDGTNSLVFFYIGNGVLRFYAGGFGVYETPATVNTWYAIELENINWATKKFDIRINGTVVQTGFSFRDNSLTNVGYIAAYNFQANETTTANWDNILISEIPNTSPEAICSPFTVQLDMNGNASIAAEDIDNGSYDPDGDNLSYSVSPTTFSCDNLGENTVTLTVDDGHGGTDACEAIVTVEDTSSPVPDEPTLETFTAQCEIAENDMPVPSATDNCSEVTITNNATFPIIGNTSITWTYQDESGNTSTQTQEVIIEDTTVPVPDEPTLQPFQAQCEINESDLLEPSVTDNCSEVTVTNNASFPITENTSITWTYQDESGNTSTQTQEVIVEDTTAPVPDEPTMETLTAQCEIAESDLLEPSVTDNCSEVTITNNASFPITENTSITWTYQDESGNTSSQTQEITIEDTTGPVPNEPTLETLNAQCELVESDIAIPSATDNCSSVTINNDATFPITESTTITWIYQDESGNTSSQTQEVIVEDTTAPVPDEPSLQPFQAQCEVTESDLSEPSATDNCELVTVTNDGTFPITENTSITWMYQDESGNTSTQTQEIIVEDTTAPTVITQAISVSLDTNNTASININDIDNGTYDNCELVTTSIDITNFTCADVGENTITLTATDASGNTATETAIVTVIDPIAPTAIAQNITIPLDENGQATIIANDVNNGSFDNCGIYTMNVTQTLFDCSNIGDNPVILTVNDAYGNSSSAPAVVTIEDTSEPEIMGQDTTVFLGEDGNVSITADDITEGVFDNCQLDEVSLDINSFDCSQLGENTVTITAIDTYGNIATEEVSVTVDDNLQPIVIGQNIELDLNGSDSVSITAEDLDNGTTDNCSFSLSIAIDTFTEPGEYQVDLTATDESGNSSTVTVTVMVIDSLGIPTVNEHPKLVVYPIPAKDKLNLISKKEVISTTIYNLQGQHIKEIKHPSSVIAIDFLQKGIYIFAFQFEETISYKRIIIE